MTRPTDTGPTTGIPADRQTRDTLALIATQIRTGTAPATPEPEHSAGSKP